MKMDFREAIVVRAALVPLGPCAGDGSGGTEALCLEVRIGGGRSAIEASFFAVLPQDFRTGLRARSNAPHDAAGILYEADPWACGVTGWCEPCGGVKLACNIPADGWRQFPARRTA
ncbi:hypothetical protein [Parvibaculum sp.]|uniref:hypothetical protein n=1 Tax=Parvibaculum sp. TaxID=2024848 RepID=UPI0034A0808B